MDTDVLLRGAAFGLDLATLQARLLGWRPCVPEVSSCPACTFSACLQLDACLACRRLRRICMGVTARSPTPRRTRCGISTTAPQLCPFFAFVPDTCFHPYALVLYGLQADSDEDADEDALEDQGSALLAKAALSPTPDCAEVRGDCCCMLSSPALYDAPMSLSLVMFHRGVCRWSGF